MAIKDVMKRLMGKSQEGRTRDDRGFPLRKATPDELEMEQYEEEDRRKSIKEDLALKRRRRMTKFMMYGGDALNIPEPKPLQKVKDGFTEDKKAGRIKKPKVKGGNLFFK